MGKISTASKLSLGSQALSETESRVDSRLGKRWPTQVEGSRGVLMQEK